MFKMFNGGGYIPTASAAASSIKMALHQHRNIRRQKWRISIIGKKHL